MKNNNVPNLVYADKFPEEKELKDLSVKPLIRHQQVPVRVTTTTTTIRQQPNTTVRQQPLLQVVQPQQPVVQCVYNPETRAYVPVQNRYSTDFLKSEENVSLIFFVLGFLCSWVWLVGAIKFNKSPSNGAKKWAQWSKWFFIVTTVLSVVLICVIVAFYIVCILGAMLFSGGGYEYYDYY